MKHPSSVAQSWFLTKHMALQVLRGIPSFELQTFQKVLNFSIIVTFVDVSQNWMGPQAVHSIEVIVVRY